MKLTRLDFAQHPRPPQRELRQRGVFDSGGRLIGLGWAWLGYGLWSEARASAEQPARVR